MATIHQIRNPGPTSAKIANLPANVELVMICAPVSDFVQFEVQPTASDESLGSKATRHVTRIRKERQRQKKLESLRFKNIFHRLSGVFFSAQSQIESKFRRLQIWQVHSVFMYNRRGFDGKSDKWCLHEGRVAPLTHPPAGSVYTWTHWSSCIFCKKPLLFDDSHIDKNQIINSCFRSASEITAFSASKASLQGECGQQGLIRGVQGEDARHTWAIPLPWPLNPRLARVASCHPVTVSRQSQLCPPCVTLSATSYIGSTANSSPHCHNFPSSQASSTQTIKI